MGMDVSQLKNYIITPCLNAIDMYSSDAVNLLLGTCAQESALGTYIIQNKIAYKGGLGIYQMQKATYDYTWDKMITNSILLRLKLKNYLNYDSKPSYERLVSDLCLSTIMARLYYATFPEPIPFSIDNMAAYYKKYYNTSYGKATEQEFIANYNRYVLNA